MTNLFALPESPELLPIFHLSGEHVCVLLATSVCQGLHILPLNILFWVVIFATFNAYLGLACQAFLSPAFHSVCFSNHFLFSLFRKAFSIRSVEFVVFRCSAQLICN